MSPLLLPLTPRFLALTLASLSTVGFAAALAFDRQSILLAICFSVALFWRQPWDLADAHSFRAVA